MDNATYQNPSFNMGSYITFGGDLQPHMHNQLEFTYVRSSRCGYAVLDDKEYQYSTGAYILKFPNTLHGSLKKGGWAHCFEIITDIERLDPALQHIFLNQSPQEPIIYQNDIELLELMQALHREYRNFSEEYIINGLLNAFFGKLLKYYTLQSNEVNPSRITEIIQYCNTHYNENITLQSVSDQLFISRTYISNLFNNVLHVRFNDYINSLRLRQACQLLESKDYNMTQVASFAGFASTRTFNRVFAEKMGTTPLQYRAEKSSAVTERVKKACAMLAKGNCHLKNVASFCGFGTVDNMKRIFIAETGLSPSEFQGKAHLDVNQSKK